MYVEGKATEGAALTGDATLETGRLLVWPSSSHKRIDILVKYANCHFRLGTAALTPADVITFEDVIIEHDAVVGGDALFAAGQYIRGLTSGAIALILKRIDATHIRVIPTSGVITFAEVINETATGLAGGDTGDAANTVAATTPLYDGIIPAKSDEFQQIFNKDPATNVRLALRPSWGTATITIQPQGPSL